MPQASPGLAISAVLTARRAALCVSLGVGCAACVSLPHPRGVWVAPVVVPLPDKPLRGTRIGIDCASGEAGERRTRTALFEGCRDLVRLVKAMDATVVAAPALLPKDTADAQLDAAADALLTGAPDGAVSDAPVDFTIRYVDQDHSRDYCGWTLPLFLISFSLFPCVEAVVSHAEIRLVGSTGVVDAAVPLQVDVTNIYGVAALYYMAIQTIGLPESTQQRQLRHSRRLVRYVQSLVYSYHVRTQLQSAAVRESQL